jgi:asparagine N-glycosylation enzyme membrane subunit Stt3
MLPRMNIHVKGTTGLIIAAVIMIAVAIAYPPYWIILGICVGIGLVVALILYLRNKYSPIRDEDINNNKRPLGLD